MNRLYLLITAVCLILATTIMAHGQDPEPEAYLRVNTMLSGGQYVETSNDDQYYYVEIYMTHPLDARVYDDLKNNKISIGGIAQGHRELSYPLQISPDDCPADDCARTHFRVYLPKTIDLSKTYEIFFDSYRTTAGDNLRYRAISIGTDYKTSLEDKSLCEDALAVKIDFETDPAKTPLKVRTAADRAVLAEYLRARISFIYDFLSGLNAAQLNLVDLRVRPLKSLIKPPAEVSYTEPTPGTFLLADGVTTWVPTEADLPRLYVTSLRPANATKDLAINSQFILSCVWTRKHLPTEDFNATLSLPINPPRELVKRLMKTGVAGLTTISSPALPATNEKVGERTVEQDLDLAFSLISSVEEVEKKNPDPEICDPIKTRERKTRGTIDLRINPLGTRSWIFVDEDDLNGNNERTTGAYVAWAPVFIDSKVSTGKITTDTLSLNRVVIGTQGEYRYIYNNSTFPTYFRLIGRFSNASDRDFKQAEYKGTFEFRPVFGKVNHPLASIQAAQPRLIGAEGESKNIYKTYKRGGYEFIPIVGGELGRTWSRRDPAEAVKPSDAVKRVYGGLEIILTPITNTKITLTDTFYYNFGEVTKRRANYFNGSIEFLLGEFLDNRRAAHSVFFSFEKGQQPPFANAGVNVFKIGYRVVGDRLFLLSNNR
ncbi:MAG TPA: hypothetical protein VFS76_19785 [Pyrinomonadaceae bacterium]|nr:hypothetical protein [Pyrinomonadaceae bacterium]